MNRPHFLPCTFRIFCSDITMKKVNLFPKIWSDFAVLILIVQFLTLGIDMWNRQVPIKDRIKQKQNTASMFQIQPYSLWDKQRLDVNHEIHSKLICLNYLHLHTTKCCLPLIKECFSGMESNWILAVSENKMYYKTCIKVCLNFKKQTAKNLKLRLIFEDGKQTPRHAIL